MGQRRPGGDPVSVEQAIRGLAAELAVELPPGLSDEDFAYIATQLLETSAAGVMSPPVMRGVVNRARDRRLARPSGGDEGQKPSDEPAVPRPAPHCPDCSPRLIAGPSGIRWRHTCARLQGSPVHPNVIPFPRQQRLGASTPHPGCKAAWVEQQGTVCWRCAPLLHSDDCECPPCREFWATVDIEGDHP
jgi:hypothetical protein